MIRLLEQAAGDLPDQVAVVTRTGATTYRKLLHDAQRVAAALVRLNITRFAVLEPDAACILRLLAGAARVGAEPCQYQPDTSVAAFTPQAETLGHSVVVTSRRDLPHGFQIVEPADLLAGPADAELPAPERQPLMIRTTGTTGVPKAAHHDWSVLARTVANVPRRPDQRWLLAYGPHQFAGIQVLQHVVASRATLVAPFPRQPSDGLQSLLNDGVTCVSATPTYWRFLLGEARSRRVALPALEQITLGGEAVPGDLLEDLKRQFPDARISQVYASTEFGSIASVRDGRPGIDVRALYSESNPTSNLRVVDGELWVRATAGMLGYAGQDVATDPSVHLDGDWHATGDLVEIVGERVEFRGRASEVINVGGVKVHPRPVEDRITAIDSVSAARVFGRPSRLTGAIVAAEVVPRGGLPGADLERIRLEIRRAVADLPRAWHPRSVSFVDAIATKGGKTSRRVPR
jgi:acyl-CoA synthetase (AMP-forming)/AMP-acid ligase II